MTPADCDLRDFAFMPLDARRLLTRRPGCWARLTRLSPHWQPVVRGVAPGARGIAAARERACGCWRTYPAGQAGWKKVRDHAARLDLCSDGRLYHPVVAEKAIGSMGEEGDAASEAARRMQPDGKRSIKHLKAQWKRATRMRRLSLTNALRRKNHPTRSPASILLNDPRDRDREGTGTKERTPDPGA